MTESPHVVLGASGGAGNAIARALLQAGHPVRAVNRSGRADLGDHDASRLQRFAGDITDADQAKQAVHGAEVVYMAAQPAYHRWPEEFPPMLETVITATGAAGAKLVMVDNCYGYGPVEGPMTESTPERATDRKGRTRRAMAARLLQAHRDGEVRVTIGRASDYLGAESVTSAITALVIEPAITGGTMRWLGNLDVAHSIAYLPDIARAFVVLGTDPRADGRVWHLPHAPAITGRQFMAMVNQQLPEPRRTGRLGKLMLRIGALFDPTARESLAVAHQWTDPFVVDDSAFINTFGPFEVTPLRTAITGTVSPH